MDRSGERKDIFPVGELILFVLIGYRSGRVSKQGNVEDNPRIFSLSAWGQDHGTNLEKENKEDKQVRCMG